MIHSNYIEEYLESRGFVAYQNTISGMKEIWIYKSPRTEGDEPVRVVTNEELREHTDKGDMKEFIFNLVDERL